LKEYKNLYAKYSKGPRKSATGQSQAMRASGLDPLGVAEVTLPFAKLAPFA